MDRLSPLLCDETELRKFTQETVVALPLLEACSRGDRGAVTDLFCYSWPFIKMFEDVINRRTRSLHFAPLVKTFGPKRVTQYMRDVTVQLRHMYQEEGSHALLWSKGASELGIWLSEEAKTIPSVYSLIENLNTSEPNTFFCWLAATEYVAEETAKLLCESPAFLDLFPTKRWLWGEAHIAPHEGLSHREIDEDLALAYSVTGVSEVTSKIKSCITSFGASVLEMEDMR